MHIIMDRIELEKVSHTKVLGIIIDEHLDWTEHLKCCKRQVSSVLFGQGSARPYLGGQFQNYCTILSLPPFQVMDYSCVVQLVTLN